jgi:hypothetical protein
MIVKNLPHFPHTNFGALACSCRGELVSGGGKRRQLLQPVLGIIA